MNTLLENQQLDTELYELYIICRHWMSDLEFFKSDLAILKKIFLRQISKPSSQSDQILFEITKVETDWSALQNNISSYLRLLEPLISKTNTIFELTIIETHSLLERAMSDLLRSFTSLKQTIFRSGAEEIKTLRAAR